MITTPSHSPRPIEQPFRSTASEGLRTSPQELRSAVLRANAEEFSVVARRTAPRFCGREGRRNSAARKTHFHPLALRVPPLVVGGLAGLGAWIIAHALPALRFESAAGIWLAAALALLGVGFSVSGVISFRRARTTVNPTKPEAATALVVSGVYRFTRNPMYLGFLFLLLGEIAWLGSPVALIAVAAFVGYLNRFQIEPEECALREQFGAKFVAYTSRVPRWL